MNIDSFEILVIILAVTLSIFLILSIILMTYLVRAAKDVSEIISKASTVVDNIEAAGKVAAKKGAASIFGKAIVAALDRFINKSKTDTQSKDSTKN